jgi:hypothetical protein
LIDEQATWGLEPSLRVVMRRSLLDLTHRDTELPDGEA